MAVFLIYPTRESHRRADGVIAVVVEAADASSALAAAAALVRTANAADFDDWATMRIADTAHADFRPFLVQGDAIVGRSPLPSLGRGGDGMLGS